MTGGRRIRSKKLKELHYIGRYIECLESKRVEWDKVNDGADETSND